MKLSELQLAKKDLSKYGKGFKKKLKDKIIREKYPDAEIIDNLLGWLTSAPLVRLTLSIQ